MSVGAAMLLAYCLLPTNGADPDWKVALYCLVSASAAIAVLVGLLILRPKRPLPWLVLANQAIYASGDVTYYVRHDLFHLTAYPSPTRSIWPTIRRSSSPS